MSAERPYPLASARQDALLAAAALLPAGGDVVTWDTAGDTAFELLLEGATRVRVITGADGEAPLLALKVAAIRSLPGAGARDLLGAGPIGRRVWFYHSIRAGLARGDRAWWDTHERVVREGVLGAGAWERHLEGFRTRVLPRVHEGALLRDLLAAEGDAERRAFLQTRWRTVAWRAAVAGWFAGGLHRTRPGLGARGIAFEARVHAAMETSGPLDSPPLLWWLTGAWTGGRGTPRWLTDAGLLALRDRLDHLSVIADTDVGTADAIDLHEAWDTTPSARRASLLSHAAASLRPGGRLLVRSEHGAPPVPRGLRALPLPVPDRSPFVSPATLLARD